jgi:hypothetical protein
MLLENKPDASHVMDNEELIMDKIIKKVKLSRYTPWRRMRGEDV